jgi:hypothetical protein
MGSSGEILFRVIRVVDVEQARIPALELRPERVVERLQPGSSLQVIFICLF